MARKPPGTPPEIKFTETGHVTEVREYALITPLFGGGVEARKFDPVTTIRAASVRGQLRFWWRATRGGQFANVEAMRDAEEALWGGPARLDKDGETIGGQSAVQVEVVAADAGKPAHPYTVRLNPNNQRYQARADETVAPAYAAFPLQPTDAELGRSITETRETAAVQVGVTFTLRIQFPAAQEPEVRAVLWAWETFGGLGARTRRGFGALQCRTVNGAAVTPLPATTDGLQTWLQAQLGAHVRPAAAPTAFPTLSPSAAAYVIGAPALLSDADEVWTQLIGALKDYRQQRNPGQPAGRSRWPEPDAVRVATGMHHPAHAPRHPVRKLPRARFGLPIIVHFKTDRALPRHQDDPYDVSIEGATSDRLASPLILRPLAVRGGYVGLACALHSAAEPPGGVVIRRKDRKWRARPNDPEPAPIAVPTNVSVTEAAEITTHGGQPLAAGGDVLHAFLTFLTRAVTARPARRNR